MSDARDARGGGAKPGAPVGAPRPPTAPRAAPPLPPQKAISPKPPQVTPQHPPSRAEEPSPGGWDELDTTVDQSKKETPREMVAAQRTTPVNPVVPVRNDPAPVHRVEPAPMSIGSASRALDAAMPGLSSAMREQVWAIVRAAVDESIAPLQAKLRDVETKLEKAASARAAAVPAAPVTTQAVPPPRLASMPPVDSSPPGPLTPTAPVVRVPQAPAIPISLAPPAVEPAPVTRPSYHSTSYGIVSTPPGPPPRSIQDAADAMGAIEIPDFGRKKRIVGRVIVAMMLLLVVGAIIATILSHQNI